LQHHVITTDQYRAQVTPVLNSWFALCERLQIAVAFLLEVHRDKGMHQLHIFQFFILFSFCLLEVKRTAEMDKETKF
jgi:hypothetical protein